MNLGKRKTSQETELTHTERAPNNPYQYTTLSIENLTLHCNEGPHKGLKQKLDQDLLHIGRADWCDISLPEDKSISRHHCEIKIGDDGVRIRDLGSRNGIYINDVRVFEALIAPEHNLRIGSSHFQLISDLNQTKIKVRFHDKTCRLVGKSEKMRKIFSLLERLGPSDASVILAGETGTGKSSIAQALHEQSNRSKAPFVTVNCGTLSPTLIESTLFGYEQGAFTGANQRHHGFFEQADQGTLFLDEIGELPPELQPKLLDVLERKKLRRLGGTEEIDVDFRLVTATHRDLYKAISEGTFREDLYYRIAVMELEVPPLRQRTEDLPYLVDYLLTVLRPHQQISLTPKAIQKLQSCLWPGNVRQLRNILERSLLFIAGNSLSEEDIILPQGNRIVSEQRKEEEEEEEFLDTRRDLSSAQQTTLSAINISTLKSLQERLDSEEKTILKNTLKAMDWNIPKVAEALQISRSSLYNRLKKHNLERN